MADPRLVAFLAQHIEHRHEPSEASFAEVFARHSLPCPAAIEGLDGEAPTGFFREVEYATWQLLSPRDLAHPDMPSPSSRPGWLPLVHCYDATYLIIDASDGRVCFWDAVDESSWGACDSLLEALRQHLC